MKLSRRINDGQILTDVGHLGGVTEINEEWRDEGRGGRGGEGRRGRGRTKYERVCACVSSLHRSG